MSATITGPNGNDITGPVQYMHGGKFLDLRVRAADKDTLIAAMVAAGLMVDDPDRGPVDARGSEAWHIGAITLVPAVMDGEDAVTPAVMDDGHSANIRLRGAMIETVEGADYPAGLAAVLAWMQPGSAVELFDPVTPELRCAGD